MREYTTIKIDSLLLQTVQCDICKKNFDTKKIGDMWEIQEMITIEHTCGYKSVIGDGVIINLDICQHCFKNIIGDRYEEDKG